MRAQADSAEHAPCPSRGAAAVHSIAVTRLGIGHTMTLTARSVGIELEANAASRALVFSAAFHHVASAPA
jgi:hypothetical protein